MNKRVTLGTTVALILFAVLLAFTVTYLFVNKSYQQKMNEYLDYTEKYEKLYNLEKIVKEEYVGDIDEDDITDGILKGYIEGLGDKYGSYYTAEEFAELELQMSGKKVGIGVTVSYDEETDSIEVLGVTVGSPAEGAGIKEGDRITAAGDYTVAKDGYEAVIDAISGTAGEAVNITVVNAETGTTSELKIVRAVVSYTSVSGRLYNSTIAIVQITEFNTGTAEEFKKTVNDLITAGATSFIFDVRNNLGGDLDAICEVLDFILPEGPIVRLVDSDGNTRTKTSDESHLDINICVLTNGYTASAAELFTAAIRDYDYGKVVGTQTYGKGTAQTIKKFSDNSGLRLSTEMYMPPYSDNYEGVGITPDVVVEYEAGVDGREDSQVTAAVNVIREMINTDTAEED